MHLKKIIFISILLILNCCNSEIKRQRITYYPSQLEFKNPEFLVPINLDTTKLKFGDLVGMTPGIDYRKNVPFFEIRGDSITKRIVPFLIDYPWIKRDEVITITMDSIIADKKYHIDDLEKLLKTIFGNQMLPELSNYQKNRTVIRLAIDIGQNSSGRDVKKILLKTTDAFDKVKNKASDSLDLVIYFDTLHGAMKRTK